jgi:DNA polymerase III epsilon subunit-like protein
MTMPNLVFLDTETTSLRPDRRAWEVATILRRPGEADVEQSWFVHPEDLDLGNADVMSLKIGRFFDRHPNMQTEDESAWATPDGQDVLQEVEVITRGAILVGAVPNFDADVLGTRMRAIGVCPSWHYHLVDVETLAAGDRKLTPPWSFDSILAAYGLAYDEADRHTALGDARMVRDLYDAILGGQKTAEDASLPCGCG